MSSEPSRNPLRAAKRVQKHRQDSGRPCTSCTRSAPRSWSRSFPRPTYTACWCTWCVPAISRTWRPRRSSKTRRRRCRLRRRRCRFRIPRRRRRRSSSACEPLPPTPPACSASLARTWRRRLRRSRHPVGWWRAVTCGRLSLQRPASAASWRQGTTRGFRPIVKNYNLLSIECEKTLAKLISTRGLIFAIY